MADPANPAAGCELVLILGGDGSILRGAELSPRHGVPIPGINLGHVGFLAEADPEEIGTTVDRIVAGDYLVEERLALQVRALRGGEQVFSSWALNEVTVEKASRERMIELTVEIDGRPLSTWGCDGLVMATPTAPRHTRSRPVAPSCGRRSPLLLVPISAHALFARPVVVGPASRLAVEILPHVDAQGVVWCDGRRAVDLPVARGSKSRGGRAGPPGSPSAGSLHRPTGRQVSSGRPRLAWYWAPIPMLSDIAITDLRVIDHARLDLDRGLTVLTGETGAGKTMVVTGLGCCWDPAPTVLWFAKARHVGRRGWPPSLTAIRPAQWPPRQERRTRPDLVLVHGVSAEDAHVLMSGAAWRRSVSCEIGEHLVAVHGQSDQWRLRHLTSTVTCDRFGGPGIGARVHGIPDGV